MDITVHHKTETTTNREKGQDPKRKNKRKIERRKASRDRRSSVNDGIFVSLSTYPDDRRSKSDRRQGFTPPHIVAETVKHNTQDSLLVDTIA